MSKENPLFSEDELQAVEKYLDDCKTARIEIFNNMTDDEQEPIVQEAIRLRYGPTGYDDNEAIMAAITGMVSLPPESEPEKPSFLD
jgi:hypothetical protein